jgi:hypothetical protein
MSLTLNYQSWEVLDVTAHTITVAVDPQLPIILPRSSLPPSTQPGDLLLIVHTRPSDLPLQFRTDPDTRASP